MDDDNGLREALRKFTVAWMGEEEIARRMKEPGEMVDAWNDARRLPAGPKTREDVLDFLAGLSNSGLTDSFKEYHAEHGVYLEFHEMFPPGGPIIGMLKDMK